MKIITQTTDEIVMVDSRKTGVISGIIFTTLGCFGAYSILSTDIITLPHILLALCFIIPGSLALLLAEQKKITFQKSANLITIERRSMIRKTVNSYKISDISEVQLKLIRSKESANYLNRFYRLMLLSNDGSLIFLDSTPQGYVFENDLYGEKSKSKATSIAKLLDVPFQYIDLSGTNAPQDKSSNIL